MAKERQEDTEVTGCRPVPAPSPRVPSLGYPLHAAGPNEHIVGGTIPPRAFARLPGQRSRTRPASGQTSRQATARQTSAQHRRYSAMPITGPNPVSPILVPGGTPT